MVASMPTAFVYYSVEIISFGGMRQQVQRHLVINTLSNAVDIFTVNAVDVSTGTALIINDIVAGVPSLFV